ncbi:MAG: phosphoribosylglycinamide formyltransferase [Rhodospirillales bacterium]|jgi:phosphoribosylglycinamide formyltransferase-1|nr:phosphoribosylglycinamide formyltransferase [Rhodospirillales bacterium]MDB5380953.1 phosphoribosylglycinamide formyltransferase [Rhodospirillales bacterium]
MVMSAAGDAPITRRRVAILISGRGSNMTALIAGARAPGYPAEIALVLASRADAGGLALAEAAGIPVATVASSAFKGDRAGFEQAMQAVLDAHAIELVALAGFMRILTPGFVAAWQGRMLNIHPSLLPAFPGLDTHARAIAGGAKLHGCTVHLVSPGVDEGPILAQVAVPVLAGDTEASLAARVLEQEHRIYPAALAWVAAGRRTPPEAEGALANPLPRDDWLPKSR